jgi:hypothetical protein
MKTWLDIDGVLHIKTENDLETYALRLWMEKNPVLEKCRCYESICLDASGLGYDQQKERGK